MRIRDYCTLFDSNYAAQGLALYYSLVRHSTERIRLHVLPMDDDAKKILEALDLPQIVIVDQSTFYRKMDLLTSKKNRSWREFCWTCASNLCTFLLLNNQDITYVDADCFFFSDPAPVFEEIGTRSIGITPHRLIESKRHLEVNGKFNVGFVYFKKTSVGFECAERWAEDCRNRCSKDVGCGDQKYLDEWPWKYGPWLCEIEVGVNVGPWSLGNWKVTSGPKVDDVPVVSYHFHEYQHGVRLTNYDLREEDIELIYKPYITAVEREKERIARLHI